MVSVLDLCHRPINDKRCTTIVMFLQKGYRVGWPVSVRQGALNYCTRSLSCKRFVILDGPHTVNSFRAVFSTVSTAIFRGNDDGIKNAHFRSAIKQSNDTAGV